MICFVQFVMKNTPFKIFILDDAIWYSEWLAYPLSSIPGYERIRLHAANDCRSNLNPLLTSQTSSLATARP